MNNITKIYMYVLPEGMMEKLHTSKLKTGELTILKRYKENQF